MNRKALIALPVFNEERHVVEVLTEVRKYAEEILVVDDGSSDRTSEILRELYRHHSDFFIRRIAGMVLLSKVPSILQVAHQDEYDVLVTIDCDGQHEPALLPDLVQQMRDRLENDPLDILSGSRYLKSYSDASIPPEDRRQINVAVTRRINRTTGLSKYTDAFCWLESISG